MSNLVQRKDAEMREFLSNNLFPVESIPENFNSHKDFALTYETPKSLNTSNANFRQLLAEELRTEYALHEMLTIITAMENRTYAEYLQYYIGDGNTPKVVGGYIAYLEDLEAVTKVFNGIVKPFKESLDRKYETLHRIQHGTPAGKTKEFIAGKA